MVATSPGGARRKLAPGSLWGTADADITSGVTHVLQRHRRQARSRPRPVGEVRGWNRRRGRPRGRTLGDRVRPPEDVEFFKKASVAEYGTIAWPNGADLAPEFLYRQVQVPA